jgi:hypothetical protein
LSGFLEALNGHFDSGGVGLLFAEVFSSMFSSS